MHPWAPFPKPTLLPSRRRQSGHPNAGNEMPYGRRRATPAAFNPLNFSVRSFFFYFVALAFAVGAPAPIAALALKSVPGHLRPAAARATPLALPSPNFRMKLALGLPLSDPDGLKRFVDELYNPASPQYLHFLSVAEFTDRFGPSEASYLALGEFARSNGLSITGVHANRMLLNVEAERSVVERVFGVRIQLYSHPTESRTYFAPDREPSVPTSVPLLHIAGLDNFSLAKPRLRRTGPPSPTGAAPRAGSGPSATFIGTDFRNAYVPGTTLTGTGQSVGIFALDGYYASDITGYASRAGIPTVPLKNVLIDGFSGVPSSRQPGSANEEVALDIQMAMSMAPGLSQVIVYEAESGSSSATIDHLLNRMATDNLAKQLSCSWGFDADVIIDQIFQEFAAQGQSYFLASGDYGAYSGAVVQASDNPYITVVGGTSLTTDSNRRWSYETTWDGSGGGFSTFVPLPAWQRGLDMTLNRGSTAFRNLPDVSMVADNVWSMSDKGRTATYQGTSIAAPLWAGFTALINEQATRLGKPPVGFINPAIYRLGKSASPPNVFHDIINGNNSNTNSPDLFFAVTGYDLCTGWGTPQGTNLINALLALAPSDFLQITPPFGLTMVDPADVPFNRTSQVYSLTNSFSRPIPWVVTGIPSWLEVSSTQGTLNPGAPPTQVEVRLNPSDATLLMGTRVATLRFVDQETGVAQERTFSLHRGNGGFELGTLDGWNLTADPDNNFVDSIDTAFFYGSSTIPEIDDSAFVHTDVYGMFLGENTQPGSLSQTLVTQPGGQYRVSFWITNPVPGNPNEFRALWDGTILLGQTNVGLLPWTRSQYLVTATTAQTELRFEFRNDDYAFGLDDIQVEFIPPVDIRLGARLGSTTQLTLSWNSIAGSTYQVQSLTDFPFPQTPAGWVNVGSPVVALGTTQSLSVDIQQAPRRFYRILPVTPP